MTDDGQARLIYAEETAVVQTAMELHHTSKTMTAALGRCLIACSIMGSTVKEADGSVTLRIHGGGPCGDIVCVSDSAGNVRGCCDDASVELPPNALGKLDVGGAVGHDGFLYVVRDLGFGEPYVGYSPLVSGEIAEDVTNYYNTSEQTQSVCALGVRVAQAGYCKGAGGFLLQLMPGASDGLAVALQANIYALGSLSQHIVDGEDEGQIAARVFAGLPFHRLESAPVAYRCACSREKYAAALKSLGAQELRAMLEEDGKAEIDCRFCGKQYLFDAEDLRALLAALTDNDAL